ANELLAAAISQKVEKMRFIPFATAISFRPNIRYARYLLIPLLIILIVFVSSPDVITKGTYRLVNFRKPFSPPPPFNILLKQKNLEVIDGEDFKLDLSVTGKEIPSELYLYLRYKDEDGFQQYGLTKLDPTNYQFTLKSVHKDFEFYVGNDLAVTDFHEVHVLQRPSINQFQVVLKFPAYTRMSPETLSQNIGDIHALVGTVAEWNFLFKGPVQTAQFSSDSLIPQNLEVNPQTNKAKFSKRLMKNEQYRLKLFSERSISNLDTVQYTIDLFPDKYPSVTILSPGTESLLPTSGILPLELNLSDDYGFSKVEFHYRVLTKEKNNESYKIIPLTGFNQNPNQLFNATIDLVRAGLTQGERIEYFIKVYDNDGISGAKASTSVIQTLLFPSVNKLYEEIAQNNQQFEKQLDDATQKSEEINKQFEDLQKKFLDKKNLSYEDKKQIQQMLESQKNLMNEMQEIQQNMQENLELSKNNQLLTKETIQKMEQLQKMMNELQNSEFKKLLEELQKKLDQMDPRQLKQQMENLKLDNEALKQELERMMELFNQLKVEQKVEEILNKLEELKNRQDLLKEQVNDAKSKEDLQNLENKQKDLQNQMNDLKQDLKTLEDLKNKTQSPDKETMQELQKMADDTMKEMQNASQNLQQNNKKQSQQNQKNSSQKMDEMMDKLEKMQNDAEMEQDAENMEDLRNLLENLLKLSFNQEDLRDQVSKLKYNDPQLSIKLQKQQKIKDDMVMIKDSLIALSKRAFQIKKFVTDEVRNINKSIDRSIVQLKNKQVPIAVAEQQNVMTGLNNLANMLTESLSDMQNDMKQKQGQKSACKKPSGGKPTMQQLAKMQGELNKQLQELMKSGDTDKMQELAAKQEAIRKQLKEAYEKIQQEGKKGLGNLDKIAEDMKETEQDLKAKQLTNQTLFRQQQILNRMLDFDKAVREQDQETRRESKSAKQRENPSPQELNLQEMIRKIRKEQLNQGKLQYTNDYQQLIDQYYKYLDSK
ncbi:MAG: hypothetical protein NZ108_04260, partial [Bacteroidia bacterium]|nr:hypothetical protein [Bacteroidia bacterium]